MFNLKFFKHNNIYKYVINNNTCCKNNIICINGATYSGFVCLFGNFSRNYGDYKLRTYEEVNNISENNINENNFSDNNSDNNNLNYNLEWSKDYKNLNKLLSVKGFNNDITLNNYLLITITGLNSIRNLSGKIWNQKNEKDLFISLKLIIKKIDEKKKEDKLYELILENFEKNKNLIKEGGVINIIYLSYNLNDNIKEGIRNNEEGNNLLLPSLSKKISLDNFIENKELILNIYMFTFNTFFKEFINNNDYYKILDKRNKINNYLWGYPFLIIENMNLPTLIYLFKEYGINLHGMSITRRHKLSPLEENLSNFLYVSDLKENFENSYLSYSDKIFSNNNLDLNLYKEIYSVQKTNEIKLNKLIEEENKNIFELEFGKKQSIFLEEKKNIRLRNNFQSHKNIINNSLNPIIQILLLRNHIIDLEQKINIKKKNKEGFLNSLNKINFEINEITKQSIGTTNIIKNLNNIILNLEDENLKLKENIDSIKNTIDLNKVNNLNLKNEIKKIKKLNKKIKKKEKLNIQSKSYDSHFLNKEFNFKSQLVRNNLKNIDEMNNNILNENNNIKRINTELNEKKDVQEHIQLDIKNINENINNLNKDYKLIADISINNKIFNNINNRNNRKFSTLINKDNKNFENLFYLDSPIFYDLKRMIENNPINENTQKKIENYLLNYAKNILLEKIDQNININFNRLNHKVIRKIKYQIGDILNLIKNYKNNLKLSSDNLNKEFNNTHFVESTIILSLEDKKILSLLLGRLLRIISINNYSKFNQTQLSKDLGESLLWEYFYTEYNIYKNNIKINLDFDKNLESNLSLKEFINSNEKQKKLFNLANDSNLILIGLRLLNFLVETKLVISRIEQIDTNQKVHIMEADISIKNKYLNSLESLDITNKIPMLIPPKIYSFDFLTKKEILGGFLLNNEKYIESLIIKRSDLEESSTFTSDNKICDLVNNLSSIGFKINNQVLNFILNEGVKYNMINNIFSPDPLELKKEKLMLSEKKKLESIKSRRALEKNILGLALMFQNVNEFFIPVRLDNRGRVYCMVDYLNYQSIDLAKALLLFSKEEKIYISDSKAINYLKIYGANCYGNGVDKYSFLKRIEWINENEKDILNFKNGEILKQAENKLLFLSFCFEYQKYYKNKINENKFFYSYFPIKLDATCNGFQHISMLIGDLKIAKYVNITGPSSLEDSPLDLYYYIAVKVNERIEEMVFKNNDNLINKDTNESIYNWGNTPNKRKAILDSCIKLLKLKVNRNIVKTTIMVKPYNASIASRTEYIKEKFEKKFIDKQEIFFLDENLYFNSYDLIVYSTIIDKVISNEFPKLNEFNNYLNNISNISSKLKIPIIWTVPSGLIVKQKYLKTEAIELKPFKFSKQTFSISEVTEEKKINNLKQKRALMPNLVHSLDASSLCLLVNNFLNNKLENKNIFTIHDCFATSYNKFEELIYLLKAVYIKTYTQDSYLKTFDKAFLEYIKNIFGKDSYNQKDKILKVEIDNKIIKLNFPDVDKVIDVKITENLILNSFGGIN